MSGKLPDISGLSAFAQDILRTLFTQVPKGRVISYAVLADISGHKNASRAAGTVMAKNPHPLVIPCHRVVCSDGSPGSYQGGPGGTKFKINLLESEGIIFDRNGIIPKKFFFRKLR